MTLILSGKKVIQNFFDAQLRYPNIKDRDPMAFRGAAVYFQDFLGINLHGIVIIAFELFIYIWHQDWDPQLCRHCNEVKIIAVL